MDIIYDSTDNISSILSLHKMFVEGLKRWLLVKPISSFFFFLKKEKNFNFCLRIYKPIFFYSWYS